MADRVLGFHYTLKDEKGTTIESSEGHDPLAVLEGKGQIIPKLEAELAKMKIGDKQTVAVGQAYGVYDKNLVRQVKIKDMPKADLKVGDQFEVQAGHKRTLVIVTQVAGDDVTLDGNHPLAGRDLVFDVELVEARAATAEELKHGHVHGPGGHHH